MRLSSEMFPFASHGKYGYPLDYAAAELKVNISPSVRHHILILP
jgi:UV DNA damage endonuclease